MSNNELNFSLIERIGIDKIKISNLEVVSIDIDKLNSLDNVEIIKSTNKTNLYKRLISNNVVGLSKITIKDNHIFSDMTISCIHDFNGLEIEYIYLTICVANINKGSNLENMSYEYYTTYISYVLKYIHSRYEIELCADKIKLDYLEINANILLEQEFSNYSRAIKLLMSFFSNHLKKLSTYENMKDKKAQGESYKRGNDSTEIIFYDKAKQLKNSGIPIDDDISILRIELRLKNKKKVVNAFDSCLWKDLNQKKIIEYFTAQIYNKLSKKFEEWKLEREKELKKMIISCREKSSKNWHHILMQEIRNKTEINNMIPFVLDLDQVCNVLKKIPDKNRNTNRSIKALQNISIEEDVYKNNDIGKVMEILNSLKNYSETVLNTCQ